MTTYYISSNTHIEAYILTNHNDINDTIYTTPIYHDNQIVLCCPYTAEIFDSTNVTNFNSYLATHAPATVYSHP